MTAILLNLGTVATIWGALWYLWDHNARAPGWILGAAICFLATGGMLS